MWNTPDAGVRAQAIAVPTYVIPVPVSPALNEESAIRPTKAAMAMPPAITMASMLHSAGMSLVQFLSDWVCLVAHLDGGLQVKLRRLAGYLFSLGGGIWGVLEVHLGMAFIFSCWVPGAFCGAGGVRVAGGLQRRG